MATLATVFGIRRRVPAHIVAARCRTILGTAHPLGRFVGNPVVAVVAAVAVIVLIAVLRSRLIGRIVNRGIRRTSKQSQTKAQADTLNIRFRFHNCILLN